MKAGYLASLAAYFLLLLALSLRFSKRMKTLEDFFLASRGLNSWLITLTLCASWFGATSILVSVDEAYHRGISAFWVMGVPAVLTLLIFYFFLAKPIHALPTLTMPDLVEERYGLAVRHITSGLIVWYMVLLAASQMVAIGVFLKSILGTSYFLSLVIGTGIVFIYSILGGFLAVVITDGLQFFLLASGILSLLAYLLGSTPWRQVWEQASAFGRGPFLQFFYDFDRSALTAISFTLAWTISPIAWQRIQGGRTVREAKKGLLASALILGILYAGVTAVGLLFLGVFPSSRPGSAGPLTSEYIAAKAGPALGVILFIAVVAAIMSTMDTAMNTGAFSLARDIIGRIFPLTSVKRAVLVSRAATLAVGAAAFLIALRFEDILKILGLSSEILTEGLFIPAVAMLFLKRRRPLAGLLSLILGGGVSLVSFLGEAGWLPRLLPPWPFSVPYGIAFSLAGFLVGLMVESHKH